MDHQALTHIRSKVDRVKEAFLPSAEKIDWTREVLRVLEQDQRGAVAHQGQMIDYPVELRARQTLGQIEKSQLVLLPELNF